MNEEMFFTLIEYSRNSTLQAAKKVKEQDAGFADVILEGFNNNIRWNLGHIAAITDQLLNLPAGEKTMLPKPYHKSFQYGTSPKNWDDETPSLDEIIEVLEKQPQQIKERFSGRLFDSLPKPFTLAGVEYKTIGELILFNLHHEGLHTGQINAMIRFAHIQK